MAGCARTARFIALTTYGDRAEAEAVIARVRRIHDQVQGTLPSGQPYSANDPALLAWVHVTEATSFLKAWIRYGEPGLSGADQDRYFAEMAQVALALGADPVPRSRAEATRLIEAMRPQLLCDDRTRTVSKLVLTQRAPPRHGGAVAGVGDASGDRPAAALGAAHARLRRIDPAPSAGPRRHARDRADAALGVPVTVT